MSARGDPSIPDRIRGRLRLALDHIWRVISNAVPNFAYHRCTQMAASMAYYALLSVFPTAIVMAAGAGFILDDPSARDEVVNYLVDELPLREDQVRGDIEQLLDGITSNSGTLGLIGLGGLLFTASALISAARNSLNVIDHDEIRRGALRGKGLDLLLVAGLGLLFASSFALTLLSQLDIKLGGRIGDAMQAVFDTTGALLPLGLTIVVFTVLYRVLPTDRRALRDLWPGVLVATLGYEILKRGFSLYIDNFANYSAVYGSLGAVIAFMVFVWLASMVFLMGGEVAAIWAGVKAGDYDPDPDEEGEPFGRQVKGFLLNLFRRNEVDHDDRR